MRLMKKGVSVGIALFFLIYAELRVVCGDAIACEHISWFPDPSAKKFVHTLSTYTMLNTCGSFYEKAAP